MNADRTQPDTTEQPRHAGSVFSWLPRLSKLAKSLWFALALVLPLAGIVPAQTPAVPPPAPQPPSQPEKPAAGAKDAARQSNSKQNEPAPQKVYTNQDLAALPANSISVPGPPPPRTVAASAKPTPEDEDAQAAAYWRARFTAARQKLAQDKKSLAGLQSQLELQRVQETGVDEDTGQVYSDDFMDLLHQVDAMKLTIQKDKQALSDLHEEFRHAGGEPGWIR